MSDAAAVHNTSGQASHGLFKTVTTLFAEHKRIAAGKAAAEAAMGKHKGDRAEGNRLQGIFDGWLDAETGNAVELTDTPDRSFGEAALKAGVLLSFKADGLADLDFVQGLALSLARDLVRLAAE